MTAKASKRSSYTGFLTPLERSSEVLFGLIMVLTFTGSISVVTGGREEIRSILFAALGCNFAWGIVDGAMYLMAALAERMRGLLIMQRIRQTREPQAARDIVLEALPQALVELLDESEIETVRRRVADMTAPSTSAGLTRDDLMGATGVFLIVFLSTFPVVIPFLLVQDARLALRLSHGIAMLMLFVAGWSLGRHAGRAGWQIGLAMVVLGLVLATLTYVLGG